MSICWYIYRFDYGRYLELRPLLRCATTPEALMALVEGPETEAIAQAAVERAIPLPEARHGFVQSLCCLGDPLLFDRGFPRLVASLGRRRAAEDAAELLREVLAGGKNLESWMLPAPGLVGFLTPDETAALHRDYSVLKLARLGMGRAGRKRRKRRGGLFGTIGAFLRLLLDRGPQPDDVLRLLGDLIEEAAGQEEGIAVVAL
jgi:hypothetical protein